jgi:predicted RNA-binding protein YlxR (DUF448 family)
VGKHDSDPFKGSEVDPERETGTPPHLERRKHVPVRTCITCGSKRSKVHLLRLVLDERQSVENDETGTKPGRGAYVCKEGSCMEQLPRKRLDRALRRKPIP